MKKYTFGSPTTPADPWGIRKIVGPRTIVEADTYRIDQGFVTFYRSDEPFLSVPVAKVSVVSELNEDGEPQITFADS